MRQQTFTYEAKGQTLVIHLPQEIDHHNCKGLKAETDLLMEENLIRRLVFDFSHTRFMDSSGIGVLFSRYKQMRASGGTVAYCGAGERVKRLLSMGGLEKLIEGYEDIETAIKGQEEGT